MNPSGICDRGKMMADPVGRTSIDRGSWHHHKPFQQAGWASSSGRVRFTGVRPGRTRVRAMTPRGGFEEYAVVDSSQQPSLTWRVP